MPEPLRIAVTGSGGRLGSALLSAASARTDLEAVGWGRPDYDLDDPRRGDAMLVRDKPAIVLHAAAWTDVDGCARDPALAMRRNGDAVDGLARACTARGSRLLLVSTNEVFDGERVDGRGYVESDPVAPRNAYGRSKLAGEEAARNAFASRDGLWIVRTAWLFGPPGNDFPARIVSAADRLPPGEALPVVADETGSPTYSRDLARAILDLVTATPGGLFHLANDGIATRLGVARATLERLRPGRHVRPIARRDFARASDPPPWGVLDCRLAARSADIRLRPWHDALEEYLAAGQAAGPGAP
jgi:dTDP-4-dehydrorhamnose reductase